MSRQTTLAAISLGVLFFSTLIISQLLFMSSSAYATSSRPDCIPDPELIQWATEDGWMTFEDLVEEGTQLFGNQGHSTQIDFHQELPMIGALTDAASEGQPISFDFHIHYRSDEEVKYVYRLILLLNEQQIPIVTSEGQFDYYDVQLRSNVSLTVPMQLPLLTAGAYNITVLAIREPDSYPSILEEYILVHNISLIVDGANAVRPEYAFTRLPAVGLVGRVNTPTVEIMNTLDEDELAFWYPNGALPVEPDAPLDFTIKLGYQAGNPLGASTARFAVLMFVGYRQIPFDEDTLVFYGEVDDQTAYANLPVRLTTPTELGKHDILTVRLSNPGYVLCELYQMKNGSTHRVFVSRSSIEVMPPQE